MTTGDTKPSTSNIPLISDKIFLLVITVLLEFFVVFSKLIDISSLLLSHGIPKILVSDVLVPKLTLA